MGAAGRTEGRASRRVEMSVNAYVVAWQLISFHNAESSLQGDLLFV